MLETGLGWLVRAVLTALSPLRVQFCTISIPRGSLILRGLHIPPSILNEFLVDANVGVVSLVADELVLCFNLLSVTVFLRGARLDFQPRSVLRSPDCVP